MRNICKVLIVAMLFVLAGCSKEKEDFESVEKLHTSINFDNIESNANTFEAILNPYTEAVNAYEVFLNKYNKGKRVEQVTGYRDEVNSKIQKWNQYKEMLSDIPLVKNTNIATISDLCSYYKTLTSIDFRRISDENAVRILRKYTDTLIESTNGKKQELFEDYVQKKLLDMRDILQSKATSIASSAHDLSKISGCVLRTSNVNPGNNQVIIDNTYDVNVSKKGWFELGSSGSMEIQCSAVINYGDPCQDPKIEYYGKILSDHTSSN